MHPIEFHVFPVPFSHPQASQPIVRECQKYVETLPRLQRDLQHAASLPEY
jgi:hypothetical protein